MKFSVLFEYSSLFKKIAPAAAAVAAVHMTDVLQLSGFAKFVFVVLGAFRTFRDVLRCFRAFWDGFKLLVAFLERLSTVGRLFWVISNC